MATWQDPAPVGQSTNLYSIQSWIDDRSAGWSNPDGSEVEWWNGPNAGIQWRDGPCSGAIQEPFESCMTCDDIDCNGCEPDENCFVDVPGWLDHKPFWVKAGFKGCPPVHRDPNDVYRQLLDTLNRTQWTQVAREYHKLLQGAATNVTGETASTLSEGIATLLRNRGVLGLGWGGLVVPGYVLPAMQENGLLTVEAGRLVTVGGLPVFTDPGITVSGPGGLSPAPGSGFIYIVPGPPVGAVRNETLPAGENWNFGNAQARQMFYRDDCECGGCFTPSARRRAIVSTSECAVFSIAVDVRDCSCPDALPPEAP